LAGFGNATPVDEQGQLLSLTDQAGNVTTLTYTTDGKVSTAARSNTVDGTTTTETYVYSYIASGQNTGLVSNVTLERQVNSGPESIVRHVAYTYYDGTQPYGNLGDLQTATVEDASGNALDTTYYRYYTPGDANGYTHGMKYVFNPDSYARLVTAVGNPLTNPLLCRDRTVRTYEPRAAQFATTTDHGATGETMRRPGTPKLPMLPMTMKPASIRHATVPIIRHRIPFTPGAARTPLAQAIQNSNTCLEVTAAGSGSCRTQCRGTELANRFSGN